MSQICSRCRGLVVQGEALHTIEGRWAFCRCMNCGDRFDAVVLLHRAFVVPPAPYSSPGLPVWDPVRSMLRWKDRREKQMTARGHASSR